MNDVIPWPACEWNEIVPGLYQGGHIYREPATGLPFSTKLKGVRLFDYVVSLHLEEYPDSLPDEDIAHTILEIGDLAVGVLPRDEPDIHAVVDTIVEALELDQKVLVRCHAGYNRSGLIVGMVLIKRGMRAREAINTIQRQRSAWALCNKAFENYLIKYGEKIHVVPA
jgi:protein-tyrosine phosphatase